MLGFMKTWKSITACTLTALTLALAVPAAHAAAPIPCAKEQIAVLDAVDAGMDFSADPGVLAALAAVESAKAAEKTAEQAWAVGPTKENELAMRAAQEKARDAQSRYNEAPGVARVENGKVQQKARDALRKCLQAG